MKVLLSESSIQKPLAHKGKLSRRTKVGVRQLGSKA